VLPACSSGTPYQVVWSHDIGCSYFAVLLWMYNISDAYGKLPSVSQADVTTTHGSMDGCCHAHASEGFGHAPSRRAKDAGVQTCTRY